MTLSTKEVKICEHCGYIGTDVIEKTVRAYDGCYPTVTWCQDETACWERWDKANGFLKVVINFECIHCQATFPDFKGLVLHWESHHNPGSDLRTEKQLDDLTAMRQASRIKG